MVSALHVLCEPPRSGRDLDASRAPKSSPRGSKTIINTRCVGFFLSLSLSLSLSLYISVYTHIRARV